MHIFHTLSSLLQKKFKIFRKDFGEIKYLKFVASFLITLVFTTPFYIANVNAATTLDTVSAVNKDGINDFVKNDDTITFEATAFIDEVEPDGQEDEPVTTNNIYLRFLGGDDPFQTCVEVGSSKYKCTRRVPNSGFFDFKNNINAPDFDYAICLYKGGDTPADGANSCELTKDTLNDAIAMVRGTIDLESLPPDVTNFDIVEDKTTGEVTFNYAIQDYANDDTVTNLCSGIKEIKFYEMNFATTFTGIGFKTVTFADMDCTDACNCNPDTTKPTTITHDFSGSSRIVTVCARAFDNIGVTPPSAPDGLGIDCDTVIVDVDEPQAVPGSFKVFHQGTQDEIEFIRLNIDYPATVVVDITSQDLDGDSTYDLDTSTVDATLKVLDSSLTDPVSPTSCTVTDAANAPEVTTCTWVITLKLTAGGPRDVTITFSDDIGNSNSEPFTTQNFRADSTGPVVDDLITDKVFETRFFSDGKETNFVATFTEAGSGLDPAQVLLRLDGGAGIPADTCTGSTCEWSVTHFAADVTAIACTGTGSTCTEDSWCRINNVECVEDDQCDTAGGETCVNGICHIACNNNAGCLSGEKCIGDVCRTQCVGSSDCAPDICANNYCRIKDVECVVDTDCSGNDICRSGLCEEFCVIDLSCSGGDVCINSACKPACAAAVTESGIRLPSGTHTATIHPNTVDIIGNPLANPDFEMEFQVDADDPRIIEVTQDIEVPTAEEDLIFTFKVSETETVPTVFADFSAISSNGILNGECEGPFTEGTGTIWDCSITVTDLSPFFIDDAQIEFFVQDSAGNLDSLVQGVTILESDTITQPDLHTSSVIGFTPKKIDRKVASIINLPLYLLVEITLNAGLDPADVSILNKRLASCAYARGGIIPDPSAPIQDNDPTTPDNFQSLGTNFLANSYLFGANLPEPYVVVEIRGSANDLLAAQAIQVNCTLDLIVQGRGKTFSLPEKEEIIAYVPLFDSPVGSITSQLQSKLEGVKQEIIGIETEIDENIEKSDFAANFCPVAMAIAQVDAIVQGVLTSIGIIGCAMDTAFLAGETIFQPACIGVNGFSTFVQTFIWDSSLIGFTPGFLFKWMCYIYTCRLADPEFWADFFLQVGTAIGGSIARSSVADGGKITRVDLEEAGLEEVVESGTGDPMYLDSEGRPIFVAEGQPIPEGAQRVWQNSDGVQLAFNEFNGQLTLANGGTNNVEGLEAFLEDNGFTRVGETNIFKNSEGAEINYEPTDGSVTVTVPATVITTETTETLPALTTRLSRQGFSTTVSTVEEVTTFVNSETGVNIVYIPAGFGNPTPVIITTTPQPRTFIATEGVPSVDGWWNRFDLTARTTQLNNPIPVGEFSYAPYKSIEYSRHLYCIPGIIYNLKKHKQIKCMQYKCIEANAAAGVPVSTCDQAYSERYCLYVESAQHRFEKDTISYADIAEKGLQILKERFSTEPLKSYGNLACDIYKYARVSSCAPPSNACVYTGFFPGICGLLIIRNTIESVIDVVKHTPDLDTYEIELIATSDACAGIAGVRPEEFTPPEE